jgi:outer membrane protein TolC
MRHFYLLILTLCCIQGFAQTRFDNLEQYLEHVRANNHSLKSETFNEKISDLRVKSAWSSLYPQVRAFGSFDNNISLPVQLVPAQFLGGQEGEFREVQFGTRYNSSFGVEASLSLVNISNWKNVRAASLAQKASAYQLEDKKLSVIEQATTSYYLTLLGFEAVAINKELVNSADSLLKAAEIRFANGLIEQMDYNRVKRLHLETAQHLATQQASLEKNINVLKTLCGLNISDTLILSEVIDASVASPENPSSLITAGTALPMYHMLQYKTLQATEDLKRQRARVLPEISLFGRYTRQTFSNETDLFSGQPWYEVGVAGIRAEWNLFSGFNRQSAIRQSTWQTQIAEEELKNYKLQAERETDEIKINHQLAATALNHYAEHYKLSSENFRIAGAKYNQGVYTIDQYITIYQEQIQSQNQYLSNLTNYLVYESIIKSRNALQ